MTLRPTWSLAADGVYLAANDSVGATQVNTRARIQPTRLRWSITDLELSATGVGFSLPGDRGSRSALLRQHVNLGTNQLFVGAGVSRTARNGLDSRGTMALAGLKHWHGPFSSTITLQRSRTDDFQLMEAAGYGLWAPANAYQLQDATVDMRWQTRRVELSASHAWRAGYGHTFGTSRAHMLLAAVQPSRWWQVQVFTGRQLSDPLRGIPLSNVSGVGVRYMLGAPRTPRAAPSAGDRIVANAEYRLEPVGDSTRLIVRIDAPPGSRVEVASSATQWTPRLAALEGSAYVSTLALPSGTHRIAIRVNGGEWRAPRGLVRVADDFGGFAGLVVVP
jgi:hypothetical protein